MKEQLTHQHNDEALVFTESLFARDGLENLMANLNTGHDKRAHSRFVNNVRLSSNGGGAINQEINNLYRTNWIAGKVVDIIPNDMTREWRTHTAEDPKLLELLAAEEKKFQVPFLFNEAHKWGRLYGTAAIILAVDDGQEPDQPLDMDRVRPGSLRHMKVVDRSMLYQDLSVALTLDPLDPNFGMPEHYRLQHSHNTLIHNSRVLRFDGVKLPHYEMQHNGYMGDSVLDRIYDVIIDFCTATTGASSMIYNMNVDVFTVEGLMNLLQNAEGEELIKKRFALIGLMKSFNNAVVIDSKEQYVTRTHTFSGLPDLIEKFSKILAAATDIPATRLLGSAPGGLNATGESDLRNYYDNVRARQVNEYGPKLDILDKLFARNLGLANDIELTYEFNPLRSLSEEERATVEKTRADRDGIYLLNGAVDEATVARDLEANGTYSNISKDITDPDGREDRDD